MSHCRSLNWVKAVDCRHNEKRLLYALSWRSETSQLSISVKDGATVDGLCGYVISSFAGVREHFSRWVCIICVRPLSVCSFNRDGQCEGLRTWNGQQYGSHAFLFIYQSPMRSAQRCMNNNGCSKRSQLRNGWIRLSQGNSWEYGRFYRDEI